MEGVGTRFEVELELMNCLASPEYLHCKLLCPCHPQEVKRSCSRTVLPQVPPSLLVPLERTALVFDRDLP